jgi:maleylacetoacetate isomerase
VVRLYGYWRSTTSYRVRIALNLKGILYEQVSVNLVSGEQSAEEFTALNPGQGVPVLVLEDGTVLTQSMAILDWLDRSCPDPALLPEDPVERSQAFAAALGIANDIHPINNLRVIAKLKAMGHSQDEAVEWMNDWMARGFAAFSELIRENADFCFGGAPGLADICLIPQLYNARRWGLDLTPFERLTDIETRCFALPDFDNARTENKPDAT